LLKVALNTINQTNQPTVHGEVYSINNISVIPWQSVLLVEENGVPRENHRPVASH
jgi:hypothetical protein